MTALLHYNNSGMQSVQYARQCSYASSYAMTRSITSVYKYDNFDSLRDLVCAFYLRIAILEYYFFSVESREYRVRKYFAVSSSF